MTIEAETVSLEFSSLAVGIVKAGELVTGDVDDLLQQMARYDNTHGQIFLKKPDRFITPVVISNQ